MKVRGDTWGLVPLSSQAKEGERQVEVVRRREFGLTFPYPPSLLPPVRETSASRAIAGKGKGNKN